ncbi:stage V sporulation protein AA [Aneurinibacillus terranovensis]|uniref:stage V sporulation protein AA n=1 Tax=Aneurinibacillus terranovensis TaxID=278991 RepID=UPI00040EF8F3|nr:stage V sporulation protein AA [Aneurinibacillus terranovensis]
MDSSEQIYVKLHSKAIIAPGRDIRIRDVADLLAEGGLEAELRELVLHSLDASDGNRYVIHIMDVINAVRTYDSSLSVHCVGPEQTLIYVQGPKKKPNFLLIAVVWIILFIGSGLAIMNFHIDVSMLRTHQRIYELMTGRKSEHPLLLQISYSIGVGAGMVLFFNHLFRKRFNDEPSPLELEMFLYQQSIDQYVLTHETNRELRRDE